MCKSHNPRVIDKCMVNLLEVLRFTNHKVIACCCGHHKYDMTIVCRAKNGVVYELMHLVDLPRKKRFYVKDKEGYYFIPECLEVKR